MKKLDLAKKYKPYYTAKLSNRYFKQYTSRYTVLPERTIKNRPKYARSILPSPVCNAIRGVQPDLVDKMGSAYWFIHAFLNES